MDHDTDGHAADVKHGDDGWLEALADVQAVLDADMRDDAYELFVAESARCRLADRTGSVRVTLRSGRVIEGALVPAGPESVDGCLWLADESARRLLIPADAVLTVTGARSGLRDERAAPVGQSIGAWLRQAWSLHDRVQALLVDGRSVGVRVVHVGADHVDLADGGEVTTVPWAAVEAWIGG